MLKKYEYLDKRIIKTRSQIQESFLELLLQNEFNDITITTIVKKAKISRVTFYNHYSNKESLLNEIIDDVIADFIHAYREPYRQFNNFSIKDVKVTSVRLFDHVYQNKMFYTAIVNSHLTTMFSAQLTMSMKKIGEMDYRVSNAKINHELFTTYQAYAITGLIVEWVRSGLKYSPNYMSEQLMNIVIMSSDQRLNRV